MGAEFGFCSHQKLALLSLSAPEEMTLSPGGRGGLGLGVVLSNFSCCIGSAQASAVYPQTISGILQK